MKKAYIFSEMFGSYSYTVMVIQANSLEEAVKKMANDYHEGDKLNLVRGYNYDPEKDINHFYFLNNQAGRELTKDFADRYDRVAMAKLDIFKKPYKELVEISKKNAQYDTHPGISGVDFINTNTQGWYDWIEIMADLPEGYSFVDGHDG